jgi:hypothetical protein
MAVAAETVTTSMPCNFVNVSHSIVPLSDLVDEVRSDEAGAIATFSGTTRNTFIGMYSKIGRHNGLSPHFYGHGVLHSMLPKLL